MDNFGCTLGLGPVALPHLYRNYKKESQNLKIVNRGLTKPGLSPFFMPRTVLGERIKFTIFPVLPLYHPSLELAHLNMSSCVNLHLHAIFSFIRFLYIVLGLFPLFNDNTSHFMA